MRPGATTLHDPGAIAPRLQKNKDETASLHKAAIEMQGEIGSLRRELADLESHHAQLAESRERLRAAFWWLGIGWLIWSWSGKKIQFEDLERQFATARQRLGELTRRHEMARQQEAVLEREREPGPCLVRWLDAASGELQRGRNV